MSGNLGAAKIPHGEWTLPGASLFSLMYMHGTKQPRLQSHDCVNG